MTIQKLLDWFIHDRLKCSSLEYSRAKNVAGAALVAATAVPLYAWLYYHLHHYTGALSTLLIGIVFISALFILKFTGNLVLARRIIVSITYLCLFWLTYSQGSILSPPAYWLAIVPVLATFLGGFISGLIWCVLVILIVTALYLMQVFGYSLPITPVSDILLLQEIGITGFVGAVLALIYFFEKSKVEGFNELEKAMRIVQEKSIEVQNAGQELSLMATRNKAILNAVADGIITTDKYGNITSINRAIIEMFAYDNQELVGKNLQLLFTNNNQLSSSEQIFSLANILNKSNMLHELIGFRKDGGTFPLELAVSHLNTVNDLTYICAIRDVTERKKSEERLSYLAHYDHLTTLPNRTLFEILLNKAIARAKRANRSIALLYLDLDYFKNVNDTLGHDIGDLLLKEVAIRISKCIRQGDTVARLGGDEFTVILEEIIEPSHAAKIAQNILDILNPPFNLNGYEIFTNASIGIAIYPLNGKDATTLTKHADMALYIAKEKGRRNFQYFNSELNAQHLSRIALENNLHNALSLNEFSLNYQPIIDIQSNTIVGIEALLRWKNPTLGNIAPEVFIPIAEKIGIIIPIGEWVIKTACAQFKKWQDAGLVKSDVRISINLSSAQLKQENLEKMIVNTLKDTAVNPNLIELELTETTIMQDQRMAVIILQQLGRLGLRIAIDDFGTGYSSLSYLKTLPVHTLKIDKSFVQDVIKDQEDALIVRAIIALGHGLSLKVIAEGVETMEQLAYLRKNNCDYAQGYYISVPLDAEAMTEFLRQKN